MVPAWAVFLLGCLGVFNIVTGNAQLIPGIFGVIAIAFFDMWLFIFPILWFQPSIILFETHISRGFSPIFYRTKIKYEDIKEILHLQDSQYYSYYGFIMKNGTRHIIKDDDRFDDDFTKEFLARMKLNGFIIGEPQNIKDRTDFTKRRPL
jgi:hypothetical protein